MTRPAEDYDVVVIGSGFGGSIAALRLAEAGEAVLIMERGRRWAPGEFPRNLRDTNSLFWRYPDDRRATGLFDFRALSGISTIVAAGVGGGSLVYASVHYRPDPRIFEDPRWPRPFSPDTLDPYYARVGEALAVETVPAELEVPKRDAFHRAAHSMGRRAMDTPLAVSWSRVHGAGEGRTTCRMCSECEFGCTYGAKNTLDFTYLARADEHGARIAPGRLVSHIAPGRSGGWEVHYTDVESGERGVVTGRRVVVAAGTLGTNEILLRSRDVTRTLPKLSPRLGMGYSGNGDLAANIQNATVRLDPWVGPDVTSVMWFDDFVLAAPTFNRPVLEVLASFGQPDHPALVRRLAPRLWGALPSLIRFAFARGLLEKPLKRPRKGAGPAERMTTVFAVGRDNAGGRLLLRRGRLDIAWDHARENEALIGRQRAAMQALAREYGGTYADLVLWDLFGRTMTFHSLGGCALSESPDQGVVGIDGQVHGHPGLYVADGSVMPTAIGCHPVMTISAVAEWIADHMLDARP